MRRLEELGITIISIMIATTVGMFLREWGFSEVNIVMCYIVGIVVISRYTTSWYYSVIGAFVEVGVFNYFFVHPYYSFKVDQKQYIATFVTIMIVAFVIGTLTQKVIQESISTQKLYDASKRLLESDSLEQTKAIGAVLISDLLQANSMLFEVNQEGEIHSPLYYDYTQSPQPKSPVDEEIVRYGKQMIMMKELSYWQERQMSWIPVMRHGNILGLVGVLNRNVLLLNKNNKNALEAISAQIGLALDREYTRLRHQDMKLNIQREKLKNSMLQSVSHDLRTPLTSILGTTNLLIENRQRINDEKVGELLKGIYEESKWLFHSVENILHIARIDDGRQIINKEPELLEDVIETVRARLDSNYIHHVIQVEIKTPFMMIPMDATLMVKVFYNLIDNAIKYSPVEEPITIWAETIGSTAYIEVRDGGPGISEGDIESIFKRFYRSKNKLQGISQSRNGIGIGLAICKAIVEAHGGRIEVYNQEDKGAVFRVLLPIEEANQDGE